jgi:hypothetical protein
VTNPKSPKRLSPRRTPRNQYREVHGKVIEFVEHEFEEGTLYVHVRFTDRTELCWRISTLAVIEEADLGDWKSGDFEKLKVFVKNQRDRGA